MTTPTATAPSAAPPAPGAATTRHRPTGAASRAAAEAAGGEYQRLDAHLRRGTVGELFALIGHCADHLRGRGVAVPADFLAELEDAVIEHDARSGGLDVHLSRIPAGEVA